MSITPGQGKTGRELFLYLSGYVLEQCGDPCLGTEVQTL